MITRECGTRDLAILVGWLTSDLGKNNKIKIIKYVRVVTGWGLKETKDFVDNCWGGGAVIQKCPTCGK